MGRLIPRWSMPEGWRIPFLIVVSIYANIVGHRSKWSTERHGEVET
jgi:hypothetical protein